MVLDYLKKTGGIFPVWMVKQEYAAIKDIAEHETREVREALNEINTIKSDMPFEPATPYLQSFDPQNRKESP